MYKFMIHKVKEGFIYLFHQKIESSFFHLNPEILAKLAYLI